ncbi:MAG: amidohydrolase family protein [Promethearchaeota archaeon]
MSSRKENWASFRARYALLEDKIVENIYINVSNGLIKSISKSPEVSAEIIDLGEDRVIFPGLINTHSHAFQSLLRGYTNDCNLDEFLKIVYGAAESYEPDDIYRGSRNAFEEMLQHGITTVCEFFYLNGRGNTNAQHVIKAALDVGLRINLNRCLIDNPDLSEIVVEKPSTFQKHFNELHEEYLGNSKVLVMPAAHSVYYTSEIGIRIVMAVAREKNCKWFMHFSDSQGTRDFALEKFGKSEAKHLNQVGLLDANLVAIHAIWVDEEDIEILAGKGVSVSHNPRSNQFLGERVALIPEMMEAGILVALGTDGAASNPSLSIFDEMRHALLVQKSRQLDPMAMTAIDGFKMATSNGASISGFKTGKIAPGHLADFIACDINHPSLKPIEKGFSHFVYAMSHRAIKEVYIGGKPCLT